MKSLSLKTLLTVTLIAVGSSHSSAQILVGYNFAGLTGTITDSNTMVTGQVAGAEVYVAPNVNDGSAYNSGNVTATNLTRGSNYGNQVQNTGSNGTPPFHSYYANNSFGIQPTNNSFGTTVSSSITAGDYAQLQLTGNGHPISLSSVSFGGGSQNTDGILGFAYSTDGGNTFSTTGIAGGDNGIPIADYSTPTNPSGYGFAGNPYLVTLDLSGISALQGVTGPVTLDFFVLGAGGYTTGNFTSNYNGSAANLDDLQVNGIVVTPEPSTWALMLGGLGFLLYIQARRRQA